MSEVEHQDSDILPFAFECDADNSRKRQRRPDTWMKNFKKFARNSKESKSAPKVTCSHGIDSRVCAAASLTEDEIQEFFDLVHENKDCASQNAFALLYMIPQPPDPYRKRKPRTSGRRERIHVQYTVKKADNSRVLVCARSFISITGIGRSRLNATALHFYREGTTKPENRGGSRQTEVQKETQESIVEFVKNLRVSESHYRCARSELQYLPPELNIRKLWSEWQDERKTKNKPVCLYDTFYNIMKRHLNFEFGNPRPEQIFVQSALFEEDDQSDY